MRISIIGAGWYGCHLATTLMALGFEVEVYEKNGDVLTEASGNNQFRLHLGFHYARHHRTRIQSRDGFMRFMERYPAFSTPIRENLYAVSATHSLIDFPTYRLIMTSSGVEFSEAHAPSVSFANIDGCLMTPERVLQTAKARAHFHERLAGTIHFNAEIAGFDAYHDHVSIAGKRYDYVIDATWGHFSHPDIDCFYEPTLLLYYQASQEFPAVTMVDGPLCSVYPTDVPGLYTLSSVPFTPLGQYSTAHEARAALACIGGEIVAAKRALMEEQIAYYLPDFREIFTFSDIQRSIKTKPMVLSDDRSCSVSRSGRVIRVMSGKIDTIFVASERILAIIEADTDAMHFKGG